VAWKIVDFDGFGHFLGPAELATLNAPLSWSKKIIFASSPDRPASCLPKGGPDSTFSQIRAQIINPRCVCEVRAEILKNFFSVFFGVPTFF